MFLQAEAIFKGWDIGGPYAGNAQAAYEAAISESFKWLQVTNAQTEAGMITIAGCCRLDFCIPVMMRGLELIIWQKYIALTGINPLRAWNDYRRLGLPSDVPLSVSNSRQGEKIPS